MPMSNKGKYIRTPEIIEKMKLAQLGKKHTMETKMKMSISRKGKKRSELSEEHKEKIRIALKNNANKMWGENNPQWRGSLVGYHALHAWVKRNKIKTELCECCKKSLAKDLANISQQYKRELNDWEWLCRKCHMLKDGRLENFYLLAKRSKVGSQNPRWKGGISNTYKLHL